MQWIINAILRYKNFILYLFLLFLGLIFSGTHSGLHRNKLAQTSLFIAGVIHQPFKDLTNYSRLIQQNQALLQENNTLKNLVLERFEQSEFLALEETNLAGPQFWSLPAKVIRNSYTRSKNILLIDKGRTDKVVPDMAVIGQKGIVGIVNRTSNGYASVLSILNLDVKINAKFKHSGVFGSLQWSGRQPNLMRLEDVSVINPIALGDTLVTGGMSAYFPEGIPIGTVESVDTPENGGYYDITVELINNLTDLEYVYVIGNKDRKEIIELIDENP